MAEDAVREMPNPPLEDSLGGDWRPLAINGAHSENIGLAYGALDPATPP